MPSTVNDFYFCLVIIKGFNRKNGPQIRKLLKDPHFITTMTSVEARAWNVFDNVVANFLGNKKDTNFREIVEELLLSMQTLGCNMSIKVHYLHSYLTKFPENLGDVSEEQGERFHQDIKLMEERYQDNWDTHMMAYYCWNLIRDDPGAEHKKISAKMKFKSYSGTSGSEAWDSYPQLQPPTPHFSMTLKIFTSVGRI